MEGRFAVPTQRMTRRELSVRLGWSLVDTALVTISLTVAVWARLDFDGLRSDHWDIGHFILAGTLTYLVITLVMALFGRSYPRGSFEETLQLTLGVALLSMALVIYSFVPGGIQVPRSLPFTGPLIALVAMLALRFVVRSYRHGPQSQRAAEGRALVYGAGHGGRHLIRTLRIGNDPAPIHPVALLDDDPAKRGFRIDGVKVRGDLGQLADAAEATGATSLVIAAPSMPQERIREAHQAARSLGLQVYVLPSVKDMLAENAPTTRRGSLRQLNLEDLLGRTQARLDEDSIRAVVRGKRVLVTGAGGSIGSEIARQLTRFAPARLVLADRDESALHACQLALTGRGLLDDDTLALVDIRDATALDALFDREQPELVFHAAALKHLTLLERYPLEAWKTNVLGTLNVLRAAERVGVSEFVNISTDKAAAPTCVLGYSKRVAERLTANFAKHTSATYVSVRFGNVLGSRGSVLDAFRAQIERGGPVTVTHPDVERYFMLVGEAAQLVLQAAAIGREGEVMVLDMGKPVKIAQVAESLIELSGQSNIEIEYTGLRPGEKMSEVLFGDDDAIEQSAHTSIRLVAVEPLSPRELDPSSVTDSRSALDRMLTLALVGDVLNKPGATATDAE